MANPFRFSPFYWFPIHYSIPQYAVEIEDFNHRFQSVHSKYMSEMLAQHRRILFPAGNQK